MFSLANVGPLFDHVALNERLTLDVTDQPVENILTDALKKQDGQFCSLQYIFLLCICLAYSVQ